MKDPYEALDVDKDASHDEIKKAYRKKAAETHPDATGGDEAAFLAVKSAFDVLSNQESREYYDQNGEFRPDVSDYDVAAKIASINVAQTILDKGVNLDGVDLFAMVSERIEDDSRERISDMEDDIRELEKKADRFRNAIGRTAVDTDRDDIFWFLKESLQTIETNIAEGMQAIETDERHTRMAVAILAGYSYEFTDEREALDSWFRRGGISSLSTGLWS